MYFSSWLSVYPSDMMYTYFLLLIVSCYEEHTLMLPVTSVTIVNNRAVSDTVCCTAKGIHLLLVPARHHNNTTNKVVAHQSNHLDQAMAVPTSHAITHRAR
jgi:hypothetical protein